MSIRFEYKEGRPSQEWATELNDGTAFSAKVYTKHLPIGTPTEDMQLRKDSKGYYANELIRVESGRIVLSGGPKEISISHARFAREGIALSVPGMDDKPVAVTIFPLS